MWNFAFLGFTGLLSAWFGCFWLSPGRLEASSGDGDLSDGRSPASKTTSASDSPSSKPEAAQKPREAAKSMRPAEL